jgi:hypothetical protein
MTIGRLFSRLCLSEVMTISELGDYSAAVSQRGSRVQLLSPRAWEDGRSQQREKELLE